MGLDNLVETVVHHLIIEGMTCISHRNGFPMVSALVCDAHWTGPTVNYDARLSIFMIYQATILYGLSTMRGYWAYAKINRRLWHMGKTLKWSYNPYKLGYYWWGLVEITPMGPSVPYYELIYLVVINYEWRIGFKFNFVHNDILVIMQGCTRVNEQGLWIGLID